MEEGLHRRPSGATVIGPAFVKFSESSAREATLLVAAAPVAVPLLKIGEGFFVTQAVQGDANPLRTLRRLHQLDAPRPFIATFEEHREYVLSKATTKQREEFLMAKTPRKDYLPVFTHGDAGLANFIGEHTLDLSASPTVDDPLTDYTKLALSYLRMGKVISAELQALCHNPGAKHYLLAHAIRVSAREPLGAGVWEAVCAM